MKACLLFLVLLKSYYFLLSVTEDLAEKGSDFGMFVCVCVCVLEVVLFPIIVCYMTCVCVCMCSGCFHNSMTQMSIEQADVPRYIYILENFFDHCSNTRLLLCLGIIDRIR